MDVNEGYIFKKWDICVYAAAMKFYEGKYKDAIEWFEKADCERDKYFE